jgi:hypothetical protein
MTHNRESPGYPGRFRFQLSLGVVQTWGDKACVSQSRCSFHLNALLLKRFFGVPQDWRPEDRPICDSESPYWNRVLTQDQKC